MSNIAVPNSKRSLLSLDAKGRVQRKISGVDGIQRYVAGTISICTLLLGWEVLSRWIIPSLNPRAAILMPPPSVIFVAGYDAARSGLLFTHVVASTQRVLLAGGAVCLLAIPLSALRWDGGAGSIDTSIQLLNCCGPSRPWPGFLFSILWFGIGTPAEHFYHHDRLLFPCAPEYH